jgi:hypothetical protein
MADFFIDPTVVGPGSGSQADPFRLLPSVTANNRYLFKNGTTYKLTATVSVFSVNVTFGAYGIGPHARIDMTGLDLGFNFATSSSNGVVENLELFGVSRVASVDPAAVFASATSNGIRVRNCVIHDIYGLNCAGVKSQSPGVGNTIVEDCEFYSIDNDAIIMNCTGFVVRRCRMWNLALDVANASGDGIQAFLSTGAGLGAFVIEDCLIDHSERNIKQCIIVQDQAVSSTGGGAIRRNILLGTKQRAPAISANRMKTLYVEAKTCTIEGNVVTEGEWAIYVHSSGAGGTVVRGNVVLQTDAESLIGIQNAGENGQRTEHNVCVRLAGAASPGSSFGITQFTSGLTGTRIANNIVVGYETAYRAGVFDAATVSNNCAHDYDELLVDASLVARAMTAPVAADPLFIDPTRPWLGLKPDSPTWRAGAHVQGARDRYNRRYSIPPNIGPWAVQSR